MLGLNIEFEHGFGGKLRWLIRALADWDLNVASPIIESRVRPPRTESILDDPSLQTERR